MVPTPIQSLEKRRVLPISTLLPAEWQLEIPAEKFLVRSEYDEAEREVLQEFQDVTGSVFVANGTPGIGLFPSPLLLIETEI